MISASVALVHRTGSCAALIGLSVLSSLYQPGRISSFQPSSQFGGRTCRGGARPAVVVLVILPYWVSDREILT